jgi:hypothetical protein
MGSTERFLIIANALINASGTSKESSIEADLLNLSIDQRMQLFKSPLIKFDQIAQTEYATALKVSFTLRKFTERGEGK